MDKDKREKWILYMGCSVLGVGFAYLFLVTFLPLSETGLEHSKTIVGFILGSVVSLIIGYYWGSSNGSAAKSQTIEDKLNNVAPPKPPEVK